MTPSLPREGVVPIHKPIGKTSFSLIAALRKKTGIRKIGHAGTLDPFAEGVVIILIGKKFTQQAQDFIQCDKEYIAKLHLGITTNTYDPEGEILSRDETIPSKEQVETAVAKFSGNILQVPPMFSAKKIGGKKLYELARKGIEIERPPIEVQVRSEILHYEYPYLTIHFTTSKGTYIRSLAFDIGKELGCGAHLSELIRSRCGPYQLSDCIDGRLLYG